MNVANHRLDAEVVSFLRCPNCHRPVDVVRAGLECPSGHRFDLARQGYADLSGGRVTHQGDTADMIAARMSLLESGAMDTVTCVLIDAVPPGSTGLVIDIGAGTGHHLAELLEALPGAHGLAIDVSKPALRRAARAHPRMVAVRADIWRGLPVADEAAQVVLDVFAPRSAAEFHRVLRDDGRLIVVTPTGDHLRELVGALGLIAVDPHKRQRLTKHLTPFFVPAGDRDYSAEVRLTHAQAHAMVRMGPNAWHLDPEVLHERLRALSAPLTATVSVRVCAWAPRPEARRR